MKMKSDTRRAITIVTLACLFWGTVGFDLGRRWMESEMRSMQEVVHAANHQCELSIRMWHLLEHRQTNLVEWVNEQGVGK